MEVILYSLAVMGGLGLIFGIGLGVASKKLAVKIDERIEQIRENLPGANCGGCGFPGCDGFAAAVVAGQVEPSGCAVCSKEALAAIGKVMGVEVVAGEKRVARVLCQGDNEACKNKVEYEGYKDCKAAAIVAGGFKQCAVGCLGLGTCEKSCPFGAIKIGRGGVAEIDEELCTGCGKCAEACPMHGIVVMPQSIKTYIACRNKGKGKAVLSVCSTGCIACSACAKACPNDAIEMKDNLPVIDYSKCDQCGQCAARCKPKSMAYLGVLPEIPKKVAKEPTQTTQQNETKSEVEES